MTRDEAVSKKEEHPDNRGDDSKPDAPGIPGNEALPNIEDAGNPEKLAENQRHKYGEVWQEIGSVHWCTMPRLSHKAHIATNEKVITRL